MQSAPWGTVVGLMKFAENATMGGFASHRSRDCRRAVFEIGPQRCLGVCHCLVFLTIFKA